MRLAYELCEACRGSGENAFGLRCPSCGGTGNKAVDMEPDEHPKPPLLGLFLQALRSIRLDEVQVNLVESFEHDPAIKFVARGAVLKNAERIYSEVFKHKNVELLIDEYEALVKDRDDLLLVGGKRTEIVTEESPEHRILSVLRKAREEEEIEKHLIKIRTPVGEAQYFHDMGWKHVKEGKIEIAKVCYLEAIRLFKGEDLENSVAYSEISYAELIYKDSPQTAHEMLIGAITILEGDPVHQPKIIRAKELVSEILSELWKTRSVLGGPFVREGVLPLGGEISRPFIAPKKEEIVPRKRHQQSEVQAKIEKALRKKKQQGDGKKDAIRGKEAKRRKESDW